MVSRSSVIHLTGVVRNLIGLAAKQLFPKEFCQIEYKTKADNLNSANDQYNLKQIQ